MLKAVEGIVIVRVRGLLESVFNVMVGQVPECLFGLCQIVFQAYPAIGVENERMIILAYRHCSIPERSRKKGPDYDLAWKPGHI